MPTTHRWLPVLAALISFAPLAAAQENQCDGAGLPEPVMFVVQYPLTSDFATAASPFGNHEPGIGSAGRAGDLMICYPSGVMRNLTREAGYGMTGHQGAQAIAVRDPQMHWDGQKAIFAMVIGAPVQYQWRTDYWQLYEVTGLAQGQTAIITKVTNQPLDYNNVDPIYLADDMLVFASDRPRNGQRHLYPQLDEYESASTATGLWKLNPANGALTLLEHSPSGSFDPSLDSFGRIIFTRWDHLTRDQQADTPYAIPARGPFNAASEAFGAPLQALTVQNNRVVPEEIFPEVRRADQDPTGHFSGTILNHFMPWMVRVDGTGEETLNHIGRHEMHPYFVRAFNGDPNLRDFVSVNSGRPNPNDVLNLHQTIEDRTTSGRYWAVDAHEFGAFASGQLVSFNAPPSMPAREFRANWHSPRSATGYPEPPPADFARYRNPTVLSNGSILAAHTTTAVVARNLGTTAAPRSNYAFRIRRLIAAPNGQFVPGPPLTSGINRAITFWNPDVMVSYSGEFWEFNPIPVTARPRPAVVNEPPAEAPEQTAFAQAGNDMASLKAFMKAWNLGLVVIRNATTRDSLDKQQPFNLRVPGGVQTVGAGGTVYDIAHFQMLQGDLVRGYGGVSAPRAGRRVLARWLNDMAALRFNKPNPGGPVASVPIAVDGSIAMFVPAQRALSWQTTAPDGTPVVRERYWISVQPGEIRACDGCHGATPANQVGQGLATNTPLALRELLTWFGSTQDRMFAGGFQP